MSKAARPVHVTSENEHGIGSGQFGAGAAPLVRQTMISTAQRSAEYHILRKQVLLDDGWKRVSTLSASRRLGRTARPAYYLR